MYTFCVTGLILSLKQALDTRLVTYIVGCWSNSQKYFRLTPKFIINVSLQPLFSRKVSRLECSEKSIYIVHSQSDNELTHNLCRQSALIHNMAFTPCIIGYH